MRTLYDEVNACFHFAHPPYVDDELGLSASMVGEMYTIDSYNHAHKQQF